MLKPARLFESRFHITYTKIRLMQNSQSKYKKLLLKMEDTKAGISLGQR